MHAWGFAIFDPSEIGCRAQFIHNAMSDADVPDKPRFHSVDVAGDRISEYRRTISTAMQRWARYLEAMPIDAQAEVSTIAANAREPLSAIVATGPEQDVPAATPPLPRSGKRKRKKRLCYDRDHLWLSWHETAGSDTFHSPANIRDKWNRENPTATISDGELGRDLVEKGIQKARNERGNVPPENLK
jgi:hypothetical protein